MSFFFTCRGFAELELDNKVYNKDYKNIADEDYFYSSNFLVGGEQKESRDKKGQKQNPIFCGGLIFLSHSRCHRKV